MSRHGFLRRKPRSDGPKFWVEEVIDRFSRIRSISWEDTESKEQIFSPHYTVEVTYHTPNLFNYIHAMSLLVGCLPF